MNKKSKIRLILEDQEGYVVTNYLSPDLETYDGGNINRVLHVT